MIDYERNRELFYECVSLYISRDGIEDLMHWLDTETDFFTAPCSTKYHLNVKGGLCQHSLNVLKAVFRFYSTYDLHVSTETLAITSLFHDLCKVNTYQEEPRWTKDASDPNAKWKQVSSYKFQEEFAYGHSEKSVFYLQQFIRLEPYEAQAINGHMGFSDVRGANLIGNIFTQNKLAILLHVADLYATYFMEELS